MNATSFVIQSDEGRLVREERMQLFAERCQLFEVCIVSAKQDDAPWAEVE
jgi:hypothetical protein